jgi:outer membrane protein assembly factor BamB
MTTLPAPRKQSTLVIVSVCLLCISFSHLQAQSPRILWFFDTRDASFGQTAAGDIDGDGKLELVFGCYRNDSSVYALNAEDGSLLWKYNTHAPGYEGCNDVAPIIHDIDGDGQKEVIVPSSCNAVTFCFEGRTGAVRWTARTRGSDSPPTIGDVDRDGKLEILHGEFGGYVICINAEDGSVSWEIPVDTRSWIQTAPTLVDLDRDGSPDFVVATWNRTAGDTNKVYAFRGIDHSLLWTYPLTNVVYHGTAVADFDRDGKPELVIGDYSGTVSVLNGEDGSLAWSHVFPANFYAGAPVSVGDLDGDGSCEIIASGWYKYRALRSDGRTMWEYDIPQYASSFRGAALVDVDNDALPDVVFGTGNGAVIGLKGTTGDTLWTVDLASHHGSAAFEIDHAPVIADFDGDGTLDLFIVGGHAEYPDFKNNFGRGYAISIGRGAGPDWLMFQKNANRNGSLCTQEPSSAEDAPVSPPVSVDLFPNPSGGIVKIRAVGLRRVDVANLLGMTLLSNHCEGDETAIDAGSLPAGMYLIRLTVGHGSAVRCFLKR